MRVLVISKMQWSDTVASGNTFSNFFNSWEDTEFFSLFLREAVPQNNVCSEYFRITEGQIIKKILNPRNKAVGLQFSNDQLLGRETHKTDSTDILREKKIIDAYKARKSSMVIFLIEALWNLGLWKNKKLTDFLEQTKPDIIFTPAAPPVYLQNVVEFCRRKTGAKTVLYFADDVYCHKTYSPGHFLYRSLFRSRIRKSVNNATKMYGASQMLCDEYEKYFFKKIEPLYKGCVLNEYHPKKTVSSPMKIVYAGNLLYNRWKILEIIANDLDAINNDSQKIVMEIYTTAVITPVLDKALNRINTSTVMGPRPYEEIKKILAGADIALYVESFDDEAVKSTRLSFSTKIIDCMQSGSCMMAIGPGGIASMEYLKNVEGAIVITDLEKIGEICREIVQNPVSITQKAAGLRAYAQAHHDINAVREGLQKDFAAITANSRQG